MESISARTFVSAAPDSSELIRVLSKRMISLGGLRLPETNPAFMHIHTSVVSADAPRRAREAAV